VSANLKLELAPFGVRVVLLRTGNIATNWFDSVPACKLPRSSLYQPIETQIKTMAEGKAQFPTMDANEYARRVVSDVLSATHSKVIWRGAQASTVKWAVSWLPLWILVSSKFILFIVVCTDCVGKTGSEGVGPGCIIERRILFYPIRGTIRKPPDRRAAYLDSICTPHCPQYV
jgi:hypothetical protein